MIKEGDKHCNEWGCPLRRVEAPHRHWYNFAMDFLREFSRWLGSLVNQYGDIGLFLYCLIGLLTYMPIGPDIFLVAKALSCRCFPLRTLGLVILAYALASSINFLLAAKVKNFIRIKEKKRRKIKEIVDRYGFWGVLFVAIGPIPVREGSIVAGLSGMRYDRFALAMLTGTVIRFTLEGLLAGHLGGFIR